MPLTDRCSPPAMALARAARLAPHASRRAAASPCNMLVAWLAPPCAATALPRHARASPYII
eukprot:8407954-Lingulodinium_polyedra.AAC.1